MRISNNDETSQRVHKISFFLLKRNDFDKQNKSNTEHLGKEPVMVFSFSTIESNIITLEKGFSSINQSLISSIFYFISNFLFFLLLAFQNSFFC